MGDKADDGNFNPNLPVIDLTNLAYAAPFIGAVLFGCFALSLCYYLWRRMSCSHRYSGGLESSSNSDGNYRRSSQRQGVAGNNLTSNRGRTTRDRGYQFISWATNQMGHQRNVMRTSLPRQNHQSPQQAGVTSGNNLCPTQYPQSTVSSGTRASHNYGKPTDGYSNALSDSGGFSQATAPPPSYSHALGYQNATLWNLPGYGYQSTEHRNGQSAGAGGQATVVGDYNVLPPSYESAVAHGKSSRKT